jgi:opacity protein-like surface antigen
MRTFVSLFVFCAAIALVAAPAAAQTADSPWMLTAQVGPAFGTFGTTPNVDAKAGYRMSDTVTIAGEFGVLSHAPFEKAASIAPVVRGSGIFDASKTHVNGYHYNANLFVTPATWGRMTPYVTGGVGAFTGSTMTRFGSGPVSQRRYDSTTSFATNVGTGISYRANRWLGLNADYRHFFVNANAFSSLEHVNRFTTGLSLFLK